MGYPDFASLVEKCALAEELDFSAFYASDHLHGVAGAPPDVPFLEPWSLLAGLAARTRRLRLGCLVAGVTYRHPAVLAKIAATVDVMSDGRLELGLGAGWSSEDHESYGLDFPPLRERLERLEEAVELIFALWTGEGRSFEGRHYRLRDAPFAPRPVQRPHPPLLLAGASPRLLRLVARRAQAWVSVSSPGLARRCIERIGAACRKQGRDPAEIEYGQSFGLLIRDDPEEVERALAARAGAPRPAGGLAQARSALDDEPAVDRAGASLLAGSPEQVRERLMRYVEAGVTHFVFQTPPPLDVESLRRFCDEVRPTLGGVGTD